MSGNFFWEICPEISSGKFVQKVCPKSLPGNLPVNFFRKFVRHLLGPHQAQRNFRRGGGFSRSHLVSRGSQKPILKMPGVSPAVHQRYLQLYFGGRKRVISKSAGVSPAVPKGGGRFQPRESYRKFGGHFLRPGPEKNRRKFTAPRQ